MTSVNFVSHTQCTICGTQYALDEVQYTCPACGPSGTLDIQYDFERLRAEFTPDQVARSGLATMWRYGPLLPVTEKQHIPPLPVGWTPLIDAPRLAESLGVTSLWIKDDG